MKNDKAFEKSGSDRQPTDINDNKFPSVFTSSSNSVAVYTVLSILSRMKTKIGLEAMLEYLEIYLSTINAHNPDLKQAVDKALEMISVERLYKEVRGKEENKLIRESGNLEN